MDNILETLKIIITAEIDEVEKATKNVKKAFDDINKKADKVAGVVAGATVAAGAAIFGFALKTSNAAGDIDDASKKVGMSAEEYQKWAYAAKQSGVEASTLETLMKKQQTIFAEAASGGAIAAESYQKLGIDIKGMDASRAFEAVLIKLAGMTDITQRNAIANDIFGKSYADLAPFLAEGADGIAALRQEAVDLGGVMSNEAVAAGESFGDSIGQIQTMIDGMANSIGLKLLPYLQRFMDWVVQNKEPILKGFEDAMKFIGDAVAFVAENIDWILPVLGALTGAFVGLKIVALINGIMAIFGITTGLALGPILLIIAGVAALIAVGVLLWKNWDSITAYMGKLWINIKDVFEKIGTFVGDVWKGIGTGIKNSINSIIEAINGMIKGMNNIKWDVPKWVPIIGGKQFGISIPLIPKLANGGMVDAGQLFVAGESGAEMVGSHKGKTTVMPLENTDFTAAMGKAVYAAMSEAMSSQGSNSITLTIDGMVLAKATETNLNKLSTLQGGLKIAL